MITKHSKPFTEDDFIKGCLINAAEIVCPENVRVFQTIPLFQNSGAERVNTVAERVTDLADNLSFQNKAKSSSF